MFTGVEGVEVTMEYTDDELPFLNAFFDNYNGCADRTVGMVYADWLDERDREEGVIIRQLCVLDQDRLNHEQLKAVHKLGHRVLFGNICRKDHHFPLEVKTEGDKVVTNKVIGMPLSVIVNGWKTKTIAYFPPVKKDKRAVAFITEDMPLTPPNTRKIPAKSWTTVMRMPPAVTDNEREFDTAILAGRDDRAEEILAEGRRQSRGFGVYGDPIDHNEIPGEIKKAMFCGYLNSVRKDAEKRCLFGPPRLSKKKRNKDGTTQTTVP